MQTHKTANKQADMEALVPLSVRIPRGLRRRLKQAAAEGETSVQAIVIAALAGFLKREAGR